MEKFDSIRPYNESEFTEAIKRITSHEYLPVVINSVFLNTNAEEYINKYLAKAQSILDEHTTQNGYYAFVCEKCASVFGYYGWFFFENELKDRARRIYAGN